MIESRRMRRDEGYEACEDGNGGRMISAPTEDSRAGSEPTPTKPWASGWPPTYMAGNR